MARKVLVSKTNTLDVWKQKVNQMSDWFGNPDGYESDGKPIAFHDYVTALNHQTNHLDYLERLLFDPLSEPDKPLLGKITANLLGDSGSFDFLRVDQLWNYDSAMNGPQNDEADSLWYGDTPATPAFDFKADSVHINELYVVNADFIDSAQVYDRLTVTEWTQKSDSGIGFNADKVTFTEYTNINTLHMDGQSVGIIRPFYINKPDGIKANAHLAGYMLDSDQGYRTLVTPDFSLS